MNRLLVFVGGERGLSVARALADADHEIGRVVAPRKVAERADVIGFCDRISATLVGTDNVNDPRIVRDLSDYAPQLSVIAGFPTIFRKSLLGVAERGTINLHGGRLPQYRGGSPLNWQMINGEVAAGISVVRVDEGIDTGEVLAEAEIPIGATDTIADLHKAANERFAALALEVVAGLERGHCPGRPQDEAAAAYWHQRNDGDGRIRWHSQSAKQIFDLVRATTRPYPGAFSKWRERTVRIYAASLSGPVICGVPGRVLFLQGKGPYVVCRDRAILVESLEVEEGGEPPRHGAHLQ